MHSDIKYADQRRTRRITIPEHPMILDAHSSEPLGQLVNLSSEGLMIAGVRCIPCNTILQIRIPLIKNRHTLEIRVGVESLWYEHTAESGTYWTGFQIIDISPEAQYVLDSVLGS